MQKILSIKPEIGYKFEANGKKYVIEDKLSIKRAIEATKLELDLVGLSRNVIKNALIAAYNDLNGNNKEKSVKFADASIKIHNLANKIDKGFRFENVPILRYAALYINEENEDRRFITDEVIDIKIQDWQEGGYDIDGFFLLVVNVLPDVKQHLKDLIQDFSKKSEQPGKEN